MHALTAPLSELAEIEEICEERGREPGMLLLSGCVTSQKTHLMYALGKGYGHTLIVLSSEDKAKKLYEEYRFLNENTSYYPAKDLLFLSGRYPRKTAGQTADGNLADDDGGKKPGYGHYND